MFAGLAPVAPATLAVLQATIARRLTPQPIKLRADIELTCYQPAGIDAIKRALRAGEQVRLSAPCADARADADGVGEHGGRADPREARGAAAVCVGHERDGQGERPRGRAGGRG